MIHRSCIILAFIMLFIRPAGADTGQLRDVVEGDGLRVLVFSSPAPLRAGEVEFAVVATDSENGAPLESFELVLRVRRTSWDPGTPSWVIGGEPDPGNAFAHKAVFDIPEAGEWLFLVEVSSQGRMLEVPVEVAVGLPRPEWWQLLPLILLALPLGLLVVIRDHLGLRRRLGAGAVQGSAG
jgi:hypothetical protein